MTKHIADVASSSNSIDREELFQLVKRSDMNTAEVENTERAVIELSVLWQTSILRVAHLEANKGFAVSSQGEDSDERMVLDESMLPANSGELAIVQRASGASFVIAAGAQGEIELDGQKLSIEQAMEKGFAKSCADGSIEVALAAGVRCKMSLGGLTFSARSVAAARKVAGRSRRDPAIIASMLGAFAMIGSLVGAGYITSEQSGSLVSDSNEDRLADIAAMVNRARDRAPEEQPQPQTQTAESAQGAAARGDEGQSGRRDSTARNRRLAVQDRNVAPQLARPQDARQQVLSRGIFAALGGPQAMQAANSGPVSPFGGMISSGHDSADAWGNHAGDSIGDAFGFNGLGRLGTGFGQGGNGEGTVCTGECGLSTVGVGGNPNGSRYGETAAQRLSTRTTRGPVMRPQVPDVSGQYSRELVRRVVLRNLAQVTRCHEQGLQQNSELAGRVVVSFVISPEGSVMSSSVRENSTPVPSVGTCIASAVRTWQFTAPQGAAITVHYPFMLERAM
jgi:TonB family protein